MNNPDKLHRAVDDAKDQVAVALENVKSQAIATADEIGRTTRKTMHSAQGATEEVWSEARANAKKTTSPCGRLHARTASKHNHDGGCDWFPAQSDSSVLPPES